MKKIFLFSFALMCFAGVFGLSTVSASAEEFGVQNQVELEIGKEKTQTKVVEDENGEELTVSITEVPEIPVISGKNDGMVSTMGSKIVSRNIKNTSYEIKIGNGINFVKYYIRVKNGNITGTYGLDYRAILVAVNGKSLTHTSRIATLKMDFAVDLGGFGTLASWGGNLDAFVGQGMVRATWN